MDIAGYVAIAGVLVSAVALVALHIVPSGKSPVGDALSAYGATRYRPLSRSSASTTRMPPAPVRACSTSC